MPASPPLTRRRKSRRATKNRRSRPLSPAADKIAAENRCSTTVHFRFARILSAIHALCGCKRRSAACAHNPAPGHHAGKHRPVLTAPHQRPDATDPGGRRCRPHANPRILPGLVALSQASGVAAGAVQERHLGFLRRLRDCRVFLDDGPQPVTPSFAHGLSPSPPSASGMISRATPPLRFISAISFSCVWLPHR